MNCQHKCFHLHSVVLVGRWYPHVFGWEQVLFGVHLFPMEGATCNHLGLRQHLGLGYFYREGPTAAYFSNGFPSLHCIMHRTRALLFRGRQRFEGSSVAAPDVKPWPEAACGGPPAACR